MPRIARSAIYLILMLVPAAALARPPRVYHHVVSLVARPGATLRLSLGADDVRIRVKAGKQVRVDTDIWASSDSGEARKRLITRYAPQVEAEGNDIVIRSRAHSGWHWHFGWGSRAQARVTVTMPADMRVKYRIGSGDFRFDNPGANTSIRGVSGSGDVIVKADPRRLQIRAGSGDLHVFTGPGTGDVSLHTGSGDIGFNGSASRLVLGAGSGDITARQLICGPASFSAGSGDILARWHKLTGKASIKGNAGSGDIVLYLPAGTRISGRISTGSGELNTDFPVTIHGNRHSFALEGGAGAIGVHLQTGSGDISLRKGE